MSDSVKDERDGLMASIANKLEQASVEELRSVYMWLFGFLTKTAGETAKDTPS